jgi:hypothetical protein
MRSIGNPWTLVKENFWDDNAQHWQSMDFGQREFLGWQRTK